MPTLVRFWVWCCAYLNCAGWGLSAIHQLNAAGYAIALALALAPLISWWQRTGGDSLPNILWSKHFRRFRRPFPLAFFGLTALAFLGGAIYAPTNYDALAYRTPRVLHWLAAGQWHWIHTIFPRINTRSCGIEWVCAPVIALLKTDRPLFLFNAVSFGLLPGLVFSVFTRLGVRRQVAWRWMWLAPTGYGFLLQAGSLGNDLFGATFALAALDLALRAKTSRSPSDFLTSLLAAALLTSAKTSNLPLLLPWAVALLPSLRQMGRVPLQTAVVGMLALLASALPTMVLNEKNCGDWSGLVYETGYFKSAPAWQIGIGSGLLALENFVPPVFPLADKWNQLAAQRLPPWLRERLEQTVMWPDSRLHLDEMQIEECAGLGLGISLLLLASLLAAGYWKWCGRQCIPPPATKASAAGSMWQASVRLAPVISLLALLSQSHMCSIGRLVISYYLPILPALLAGPAQVWVVKQRWWRVASGAVFVIAAGLLIISPPRPMFPVQTILAALQNHEAGSPWLARAQEVYEVYRERNDGFAPARALLPADVKVLGLTMFDEPETSLWRPFGSRRIEHVCPQDTAADLKARGVAYILVRPDIFGRSFPGSAADWLGQMHAQIIQKFPLNLRASAGAVDWWLVKLD